MRNEGPGTAWYFHHYYGRDIREDLRTGAYGPIHLVRGYPVANNVGELIPKDFTGHPYINLKYPQWCQDLFAKALIHELGHWASYHSTWGSRRGDLSDLPPDVVQKIERAYDRWADTTMRIAKPYEGYYGYAAEVFQFGDIGTLGYPPEAYLPGSE